MSERSPQMVVATTFAAVPEWLLECEISSRAIHLFAVLQGIAGKKGCAWPSRRTLANRMRCSPDSVDRATKELEAVDALRTEARFSEEGDRTSNRYVLLCENPDLRGRGRMAAGTGGGTGAEENQTQSEPHPQRQSATHPAATFEEGFEQFWESYQRKEAKTKARKVWTARRKQGVSAEELIQAGTNYARKCKLQKTEPKFIKLAATFLGPDEHWKDYLDDGAAMADVQYLRAVGDTIYDETPVVYS